MAHKSIRHALAEKLGDALLNEPGDGSEADYVSISRADIRIIVGWLNCAMTAEDDLIELTEALAAFAESGGYFVDESNDTFMFVDENNYADNVSKRGIVKAILRWYELHGEKKEQK